MPPAAKAAGASNRSYTVVADCVGLKGMPIAMGSAAAAAAPASPWPRQQQQQADVRPGSDPVIMASFEDCY